MGTIHDCRNVVLYMLDILYVDRRETQVGHASEPNDLPPNAEAWGICHIENWSLMSGSSWSSGGERLLPSEFDVCPFDASLRENSQAKQISAWLMWGQRYEQNLECASSCKQTLQHGCSLAMEMAHCSNTHIQPVRTRKNGEICWKRERRGSFMASISVM